MRAAIVALTATIWIGIGYLWWQRVAIRVSLLAISIIIALCLILPDVGANRWIEADPGERKTIAVKVPDLHNFWFQVPVYVLRWQQLALVSASASGSIVTR